MPSNGLRQLTSRGRWFAACAALIAVLVAVPFIAVTGCASKSAPRVFGGTDWQRVLLGSIDPNGSRDGPFSTLSMMLSREQGSTGVPRYYLTGIIQIRPRPLWFEALTVRVDGGVPETLARTHIQHPEPTTNNDAELAQFSVSPSEAMLRRWAEAKAIELTFEMKDYLKRPQTFGPFALNNDAHSPLAEDQQLAAIREFVRVAVSRHPEGTSHP